MRRVLVGILISIFVANTGYSSSNQFVVTPQSEFQWWVDPQTNKVNFRRCDIVRGAPHCYGPMLLKGIDIDQVPELLSFYRERLAQSGNHQLKQFIRVITGSVGTIAAYVGTLGSLSLFKNVVPSGIMAKASALHLRLNLRTGVHIISLGALGFLLYYGTDSYIHLNQQKKVYKIYCAAIGRDPQSPPQIALQNQQLFEEFITTFRNALQDFTHGGGTYDDNGYLIFQ